MSTMSIASAQAPPLHAGPFAVTPFPHPQGCRTWLVADPDSREALVVDPHLDLVESLASTIREEGLKLRFVVDTHTHADHPSGSAALAAAFPGAERVAHRASGHAGLTRRVGDGDALPLGRARLVVREAPGHTPDHVALLADGVLFSGDSLFLGAVARTDFLGGDAGQLHDSLRKLLDRLPDATLVLPGHDYAGRISGTLGEERANNPWLHIASRSDFAEALSANPPPRPANMDDLLRLNKEGVAIPRAIPASRAIELARAGGARSIVDVRTPLEVAAVSIAGARHVPVDEVAARADEIRAMAAPRLLLCRSGVRAERARVALEAQGVRGLQVIEGGIEAWRAAGGPTIEQSHVISLERQMRITAGSIVLIGSALAFVHPAFALIAAFIGAGLVFSGVTNVCGMVLLLAKMPWNRNVGAPAGSSGPVVGTSCAAGPPPAACAAAPPPAACAATPPPPAAGASCSLRPPTG